MHPSNDTSNGLAIDRSYLFRFAMSVLASIDIDGESITGLKKPDEQGYRNLKDIINNSGFDLKGAIRKMPFPEADEITEYIKKAVNNEENEWRVKRIEDGFAKCVILKCKGKAEVFFPGTPPKEVPVWLQDLNMQPEEFKISGGKEGIVKKVQVHKGFLTMHKKILGPLKKELDTLACTEINVSGYSLGGAMATLFVLDSETRDLRDKMRAYTFAAPRPGTSKAFTDAVNQVCPGRIVNVRNSGDPVTYFPTQFAYQFVGSVSAIMNRLIKMGSGIKFSRPKQNEVYNPDKPFKETTFPLPGKTVVVPGETVPQILDNVKDDLDTGNQSLKEILHNSGFDNANIDIGKQSLFFKSKAYETLSAAPPFLFWAMYKSHSPIAYFRGLEQALKKEQESSPKGPVVGATAEQTNPKKKGIK